MGRSEEYDDSAKSPGWGLLGSLLSAVVRQLAPRVWCPLQCLLAKTVGVLSPGVGRSEEYDDRAKSPGRGLLGSPLSAVVRQLAPRVWCPLPCVLAKTVGVLSPGVGRSEECT